MGVRRYHFGREMDKSTKGKSLQATFKHAKAVSSVTRKPDKFDKPTIGDKIILALLRGKKKITDARKKMGDKSPATTRTKQITSRLKQAGLSQKEINKLRGKKK